VRRAGGVVLERCAVRGVETKGGRISGVVTEKGAIACDSVVLAGGAWSRLFAGNAGIDLPQLKVLGSVFRTEPPYDLLSSPELDEPTLVLLNNAARLWERIVNRGDHDVGGSLPAGEHHRARE
jgi:glycine/D-amino acid oxidase-like deaminating enzyme